MLILASCRASLPPETPEEALARTNIAVKRILETPVQSIETRLPPMPVNGAQDISFWYYDHPAIGDAINSDCPPNVRPLYIGEWNAAIQKLLVAFVTGDVPDVALVKRELVASLFRAGRIRPINTVLPDATISDLREEVFQDYAQNDLLLALPADGFCSVLFYNRRLIGDTPPRTWVFYNAHLNARRDLGNTQTESLGAFPFLEALWSTGGNVVVNGQASLDSAEAARALRFVLEATGNHPRAEPTAFRDFAEGKTPMTIASSSRGAELLTAGFPVGIAPVPGETGPISRRSNDAVVVFVRENGASAAAIAAFLEWLTGEMVYTAKSQRMGNVPIRKSVVNTDHIPPEVLEAYRSGQNTPLIPDWGAIEAEIDRGLKMAYDSL